MTRSYNRLLCPLDGISHEQREQKRVQSLKNLGLLETELVPVFDEATQTAAQYLETPICVLSLMVNEEVWFKSAVGLSKLGLMNPLSAQRKISTEESLSAIVVDTQQSLMIEDAFNDDFFAHHFLVQQYGIQAYLGTPLISASGLCIGALEVMDLKPRSFSLKDAQFLDVTARWCLREHEQNYLSKNQAKTTRHNLSLMTSQPKKLDERENLSTAANAIKTKLLHRLSENLLTPLTSVVGMASVLKQETYGPLSSKQKEYMEIIHNSGQNMIFLVEEIINLGKSEDNTADLELTNVDIELLCQQVVNSLNPIAQKNHTQIKLLPIDFPERFLFLDKEKFKQTLYYLLISLTQTGDTPIELCIQVQNEGDNLEIFVWFAQVWLGGTSLTALDFKSITNFIIQGGTNQENKVNHFQIYQKDLSLKAHLLKMLASQSPEISPKKGALAPKTAENLEGYYCSLLELLFSCYLAETQGGTLALRRTSSGYRYIFNLPKLENSTHS